MNRDRRRPDYRPPEPPIDWHEQDWLLILQALDCHALEGHLTEGEELRAYQLVESIARMHGSRSLGAIRRRNLRYFEQYVRREPTS
ncbi:hypothetical protein [Natronorarus salvus]|uniref:hypothetical protein n=1 Tax=Natronorarus salvus TaxID=3117733 RepID=UPI002F2633FC